MYIYIYIIQSFLILGGPWWSPFARSVELKAVSLQSSATELRGDLEASRLHNESENSRNKTTVWPERKAGGG